MTLAKGDGGVGGRGGHQLLICADRAQNMLTSYLNSPLLMGLQGSEETGSEGGVPSSIEYFIMVVVEGGEGRGTGAYYLHQ